MNKSWLSPWCQARRANKGVVSAKVVHLGKGLIGGSVIEQSFSRTGVSQIEPSPSKAPKAAQAETIVKIMKVEHIGLKQERQLKPNY
jgi:hypothetical protein